MVESRPTILITADTNIDLSGLSEEELANIINQHPDHKLVEQLILEENNSDS